MFDASDGSMNGTRNTYVRNTAQTEISQVIS